MNKRIDTSKCELDDKIVIFMQNRDFFGAQIIHIPLVLELKKQYPNSKIILFAKYGVAKILNGLNIVDKIIIEKTKFDTFKKYISINPDVTINLRKKSLFINMLISFFNFKTKIGFETGLTKLFFTKTSVYNSSLYRGHNYMKPFDRTMELLPTNTKKRISILPGAGGDFKMWNINNYISLAKQLKEIYVDYEICFVLGNKEASFSNDIPKEFKIYLNLEIKSLFEVIQESMLVIANDCGPSHIAQISDINTLILYSDEMNDANKVKKEWFNDKSNSYCIIGKSNKHIDSINVEEVFNLADKILQK